MSRKHRWTVPGFTLLALLAVSGCGGGSGSGGGPSSGSVDSGGGTGGTRTPNPYAGTNDTRPTRLGRLVVMGDSYSATNQTFRPGVVVWHKRLGADRHALYAKSGASARDENVNHLFTGRGDPNNTLKSQVDRYEADIANGVVVPQGNDLVTVYMGHNDVLERRNDLTVSLADYAEQVDRLLGGGAAAGDRKMFVTLIHDWSGVPQELATQTEEARAAMRARVDRFNNGVVDIANSREGVIAVDMRTVFDRITADPERYGLTNLTTADPAGSDSTALYYDDQHFGNRGQDIIAQVYNHYLTRGWGWANSLAAGAEAATRLNRDIDQGLVVSLDQRAPEDRLGFSSFVVGDRSRHEADLALAHETQHGDPARSGFEAMRLLEDSDTGLGLNYALDPSTMWGVVISNYHQDEESETQLASTRSKVEQDAVSFYVNNRIAGFLLNSTATFSNDRHTRLDHDELIDASDEAVFGGRTMAFATTASKPFRLGGTWLRPWVKLTHTVQQVDGYTQSNPYTSDVAFSGAEIADTLAGVGLSSAIEPIALGDAGRLRLTGGLSYTHGLVQDDYAVTMREEATGFTQNETIERDRTRLVGLHLGAEVEIGERLSLNTGYEMGHQLGGETSQSMMARVKYSF